MMNSDSAPVLSEAERLEGEEDLAKTEEEIETLKQVLQARIRHANELKRKLGHTPWQEVVSDLNAGWNKVRESTAVKTTEECVKLTGDVVKTKLGEVRNSDAVNWFETRIGSAMSSVKAKLTGSPSYGAECAEQVYAPTQTSCNEKKI